MAAHDATVYEDRLMREVYPTVSDGSGRSVRGPATYGPEMSWLVDVRRHRKPHSDDRRLSVRGRGLIWLTACTTRAGNDVVLPSEETWAAATADRLARRRGPLHEVRGLNPADNELAELTRPWTWTSS